MSNRDSFNSIKEENDEKANDESHPEAAFAGVTNPVHGKRQLALKPVRFDEETYHLICEWEDCSFQTAMLDDFMEHVALHMPGVEILPSENSKELNVSLVCKWFSCPFKSLLSEGLERHKYLHAYHTKLKCIGSNTSERANLNICSAGDGNRNILPDLAANLLCAWGNCRESFVNIQKYYDHIRVHCEDKRNLGNLTISCCWVGCSSSVANVTKLKDHMRSHTQEKLLACPRCGVLFSNRTRYFDHCRRQIILDKHNFACDECMKVFSTARLLREHIRSHLSSHRCPKCDMSCSSPSALSQHITYKHTTARPFVCQYCPYTAKVAGDVIKHYKVHEEISLCCEEPGCTYKTKSHSCLQNHIDKTHALIKRNKYCCHLCENKYVKGTYLTKHLVTAHNMSWPAGHSRFRYAVGPDGLYRLNHSN